MISLLKFFISVFIPKFLLVASVLYIFLILFIFIRCFVNKVNINDLIEDKEKLFFFSALTYTLTLIFL